jgi:colanic acid biosynthesis glycosyl transferase WcaI
MRLVVLTQYFPPEVGATQVRLSALIKALQRRGHDVEVVTAFPHHLVGKVFPEYRNAFHRREVSDGCVVHRTWVYAATGAGARRLLNYLSFSLTSLGGLLRTRRADYLFVESPPLFLGVTGIVFSMLRRTPVIFNVSDLWPDSVRELGVLKNRLLLDLAAGLERWIYSRVCFVTAITPGIRTTLIRDKGLPAAKVLYLPNGVDLQLFSPREPDQKLLEALDASGRQIFLYAGTHGIAQGLPTLVDAAAQLADDGILLLFVGDGPVKRDLIASASRKGVQNVRFVDMQPVEEMARYYSLARASIVPLVKTDLFRTARPSKIFPSLACGVPVIYSGEGETAQLLEDAGAGLVVPPEDATQLAAAIRKIAHDDSLHERLKQGGLALAQQYTWDRIVDAWLEQLTRARG